MDLSPKQLQALKADPRYAAVLAEYEAISTQITDLKARNGYDFQIAGRKRIPYPKQDAFIRSSKPLSMFCGAQGTGKSTGLVEKYVGLALGRHPTIKIKPPADFWMVGLSFQKVDQVIIPMFRRLLPEGCEKSYDSQSHLMHIETPDGYRSTIGFMSAESGPDKFQSNRLDRIGFDEAPQKASGVAVFRECQSRFKPGRQLGIDMAATPWEIPRFYRDKFYVGSQTNPAEVDCFVAGLADNPYVTKEQLEYQSRQYFGKEYRARILGEFVDLTGLVFDTISPRAHLIDDFPVPDTWPRYRAIDPTEGRRPWAIGWATVSPEGDLYFYGELEVSGTYDKIVSAIQAKTGRDRILWTAIDPFASKHDLRSGNPWTTELALRGLDTIKVDRSKRSLYRSSLMSRLGDPDRGTAPKCFFFKKGAQRMFECLMNHSWEDWGPGSEDRALKEKEEESVYKDFVDVVLYMISKNPTYIPQENYVQGYMRQQDYREPVDSVMGY